MSASHLGLTDESVCPAFDSQATALTDLLGWHSRRNTDAAGSHLAGAVHS
jgi:hypothetical protein